MRHWSVLLALPALLAGAVSTRARADAGPPDPCEATMCPRAPFLRLPADQDTTLTNPVIVVHEGDLHRCERVSYVLRDEEGAQVAITTEEMVWRSPLFPPPTSVRLRPLATLAQNTRYEVWLERVDGTQALVGGFMTDILFDPGGSPVPFFGRVSLALGSGPVACPEFACCSSVDSRDLLLEITGGPTYGTFTIHDGADLIAADTGSLSIGYLACEEGGDNGPLFVAGPPPGVEAMWGIQPGPHVFRVVARDRAGNESLPIELTFTALCDGTLLLPDAGPPDAYMFDPADTDAAPEGSNAGACACRASGRPRAGALGGGVLLAGCVLVACGRRARRRPGFHI